MKEWVKLKVSGVPGFDTVSLEPPDVLIIGHIQISVVEIHQADLFDLLRAYLKVFGYLDIANYIKDDELRELVEDIENVPGRRGRDLEP